MCDPNRLLICGSRDFSDEKLMRVTLGRYIDSLGRPDVIITGGARGADFMAESLAKAMKIPVESYPADWRKYGRRAGPLRNIQMLKEAKPTYVLAFYSGTITPGTEHMVSIATEKNIVALSFGLNQEDSNG